MSDAAGPSLMDLPCMHCGYLLRGLETSGDCPECGAAISDSRQLWFGEVNLQVLPLLRHDLSIAFYCMLIWLGCGLIAVLLMLIGLPGLSSPGQMGALVVLPALPAMIFVCMFIVRAREFQPSNVASILMPALCGMGVLGLVLMPVAASLSGVLIIVGVLMISSVFAHLVHLICQRIRYRPPRIVPLTSDLGCFAWVVIVGLSSPLALLSQIVGQGIMVIGGIGIAISVMLNTLASGHLILWFHRTWPVHLALIAQHAADADVDAAEAELSSKDPPDTKQTDQAPPTLAD